MPKPGIHSHSTKSALSGAPSSFLIHYNVPSEEEHVGPPGDDCKFKQKFCHPERGRSPSRRTPGMPTDSCRRKVFSRYAQDEKISLESARGPLIPRFASRKRGAPSDGSVVSCNGRILPCVHLKSCFSARHYDFKTA